MKNLLLVIAVILLAGSANAAKVIWDPTVIDSNTGAYHWDIAANWTTGTIPTSIDIAMFNVVGTPECRLYGDQIAGQLALGYENTSTYRSMLRIMPNATLTTDTNLYSWSCVGRDSPATLIVERGVEWDNGDDHFYFGWRVAGAGSIVEINGATLRNRSNGIVVGRDPDAQCDVSFNAGLIDVDRLTDGNNGLVVEENDIVGGTESSFDISFGTLIIHRDDSVTTAALQADIDNGYITAFGEHGNDGQGAEISMVVGVDVITITATGDPMARYPTYDEFVEPGTVTLSWVNLDPNNPADDVWVDVYFNDYDLDDPNFYQVVDAGRNTTEIEVDAPDIGEYVWRVDTYRYGDPAIVAYGDDSDPNTDDLLVDEGLELYFIATDDEAPSVAMDTLPTATWKNEPVQLNITVTDDGKSPVTYLWEADDPNAVFSPSNTAEEPTVAVDYQAGTVTVTVTVGDSNPLGGTDSANVDIYVASTPCAAARSAMGLAAAYPEDLVPDCVIDLDDFLRFVEDWLIEYAITEPQPIP